MRKLKNWTLAFVGALVLTFSIHAFAGGQPLIDPAVPGRIVVRIAPSSSVDAFLAAFNAHFPKADAAIVEQIPNRPIYLISYAGDAVAVEDTIHSEDDAITPLFVALGYLTWGELDYEGRAPEARTGSFWADSLDGPTLFHTQYIIGTIGLPAAHQRSTGVGITVAVLDTGLDAAHPEFAGSIVNGYNFITDSPDTGESLPATAGGEIPDAAGHGTFVSGLIHLVAPDAKIMPVVVLDQDGVGSGWIFAKGMFYAIDRGVEVINLSLSSTYDSEAIEDALDEAEIRGILVPCAAGNLDHDDPEEYPAMRSNSLGVAATDHADIKADFSNYSDDLFISAPGASASSGETPVTTQSVFSTLPGGGYGVWEGTSFSTPLVSGVAALLHSQRRLDGWSGQFTYNRFVDDLADTALNIYPLNPQYEDDQELGAGRLDAAAVTALHPIAPPLPPGDLTADDIVNGIDLGILLANWSIPAGSLGCGGATPCAADLNGDGIVNGLDLGVLLANWTL